MYLTLILLCLSPGSGSVIIVSGQRFVAKVLDRGDSQQCASAEERDRIRNEIDQIASSAILATIVNGKPFITDSGQGQETDVQELNEGDDGQCPLMEERGRARSRIHLSMSGHWLHTCNGTPGTTTTSATTMPSMYACNGTPGWRHVAFINMTDTSYNCPTGLNLTSYSKRTCGRSHTTNGGCSSTIFSVGGLPYSRVCGRIRGYQFGATGAFFQYTQRIDGYYVDGVSLTHGGAGSRQHIWTFAAGLTESEVDTAYLPFMCPCDTHDYDLVPAFVGNDFFCESGLHSPWRYQDILYPDDVLWDGQNCTSNSTCCQLNNPPWFTKNLTNATTDDIELRICTDDIPGDDDVPLELIELYVQ